MSAPREEWERLADLAAAAAAWLDGAQPLEILRWAAREFGDKMCVSSSMTDAVLAHLASRAQPGVPVLFLDTGYHFAGDHRHPGRGRRDDAGDRAERAAAVDGRRAGRRPDAAAARPRPGPVLLAAQGGAAGPRAGAVLGAGSSGVRRDESPSRRNTPVVAWDPRRAVVKVHPLAAWTQDDVDAYIQEHDVLVNPLVSEGYPSLGCAPCTNRPEPGADPRSGRWAGREKTECGIHV